MLKKSAIPSIAKRLLTARRDRPDFRDLMYSSRFIRLKPELSLEEYQKHAIPILDQGQEGACTGFALASVIHYALQSVQQKLAKNHKISPFWLYDIARQFDEWPGEDYEGSSCRGALKGWNNFGACELKSYPKTQREKPNKKQLEEAKKHPLGAYFRVNHKNLYDMHCALGEAGILYCAASVHKGWEDAKSNGIINYQREKIGGHAFVIVAYDKEGFWIQNSWGKDYGKNGFCHISYRDWLENGDDCWIAATGVYLASKQTQAATKLRS